MKQKPSYLPKKYKYSVPNVSLFLQDTEGYRKALRLAYQAEKFHRPVICFVDTPGAFCGVEAEKRGQGEAIAKNIAEFMTLKTPVISVVLGEGGSGGALASTAVQILNAYFTSVDEAKAVVGENMLIQ